MHRFAFLVAFIAACFTVARAEAQSTLLVPQDFDTITAAVAAANDGDTIVVGPGVYSENVRLYGKAIVLESADGSLVTTIDGSEQTLGSMLASCVICLDGEGPSTVIRGFTLTGGTGSIAPGLTEGTGGGAICVEASPTFESCRFIGNSAINRGAGLSLRDNVDLANVAQCEFIDNGGCALGGGVSIFNGAALIFECTFSGNSALISGGGLFVDEVTSTVAIRSCLFEGNASAFGGGARLSGALTSVNDCQFFGNDAVGLGGALMVTEVDSLVSDCWFQGNSADSGGAIAGEESMRVERSVFWQNVASDVGGGFIAGGLFGSGSEIDHCTFVDNEAGSGTAGGLYAFAAGATVSNSIFWNNGSTPLDQESGSIEARYSLVEGGFAGFEMVVGDPLFADPVQGDFRLTVGSPCIDAGDPVTPFDPDGSEPDLGAFPFVEGREFIRGDTNGDFQFDISDPVASLFSLFVPFSPAPDCLDAADANDDGGFDLSDPVFALASLFVIGTPDPASPFPSCGRDLSLDLLGCTFPTCP